MQNENINPIRHSALGTVSGTAIGAVGGGIKSGVKTWVYTAAITALAFGATAAVVAFTGGLGTGAAALTFGTISNALANFVGFGLVGGAVGGLVVGPALGVFGGAIGTVRGGTQAASRIRDEKGAANMLDAQLQAYQAQAYAASAAPTTVYAPSAANNNYATASTMNQAGTKIHADTAQDLGTINGMQLQRA